MSGATTGAPVGSAYAPSGWEHMRDAMSHYRDGDYAGAIEAMGLAPKLVQGSARNLKVTLPGDLALAELYLKGLHD